MSKQFYILAIVIGVTLIVTVAAVYFISKQQKEERRKGLGLTVDEEMMSIISSIFI